MEWLDRLLWDGKTLSSPSPSAGRSMKPNDLHSDVVKDRRESSSRSLCRAAWFTSPMGYSRNFTCQLLSVMNLLAQVPILAVLTNLSISLDCFDVNICAQKKLVFSDGGKGLPADVSCNPATFWDYVAILRFDMPMLIRVHQYLEGFNNQNLKGLLDGLLGFPSWPAQDADEPLLSPKV